MSGVREEQKKLEEEDPLAPGSGESGVDESDYVTMDIDEEDEAILGLKAKPSEATISDSVSSSKPERVGSLEDTTIIGTPAAAVSANTSRVGTDSGQSVSIDNSGKESNLNEVAPTDKLQSPAETSANTDKVGTGIRPTVSYSASGPSMAAPEVSTDGTYLAINLFKRKAGTAPNLLGGANYSSSASGSLFNGKAERISTCSTKWDFQCKSNVMTSFDPVTLECSCCTEHTKILERRVLTRPV